MDWLIFSQTTILEQFFIKVTLNWQCLVYNKCKSFNTLKGNLLFLNFAWYGDFQRFVQTKKKKNRGIKCGFNETAEQLTPNILKQDCLKCLNFGLYQTDDLEMFNMWPLIKLFPENHLNVYFSSKNFG